MPVFGVGDGQMDVAAARSDAPSVVYFGRLPWGLTGAS